MEVDVGVFDVPGFELTPLGCDDKDGLELALRDVVVDLPDILIGFNLKNIHHQLHLITLHDIDVPPDLNGLLRGALLTLIEVLDLQALEAVFLFGVPEDYAGRLNVFPLNLLIGYWIILIRDDLPDVLRPHNRYILRYVYPKAAVLLLDIPAEAEHVLVVADVDFLGLFLTFLIPEFVLLTRSRLEGEVVDSLDWVLLVVCQRDLLDVVVPSDLDFLFFEILILNGARVIEYQLLFVLVAPVGKASAYEALRLF